jgi:hypothetical protein
MAYWVAGVVGKDSVCGGEFSVYRDSKLQYCIVMSRKLSGIFCCCSGMNSRLKDTLLN